MGAVVMPVLAFCFVGLDRLEDGGQYVCRLAARPARSVGKHKRTEKN